jgi:hypothetical protein
VLGTLDVWAKGNAQKQPGLVVFHGSRNAGTQIIGERKFSFRRLTTRDFSLWDDDSVSAREVAGALKSWPPNAPLVLVMVQCHAGGFANVLWEGGDPKKPGLEPRFLRIFSLRPERAPRLDARPKSTKSIIRISPRISSPRCRARVATAKS